MMGISRDFDVARTGHDCTFVIGVKATQYSVYVNGRPAITLGAPCLPHLIRFTKAPHNCIPHPGAIVWMGSLKVFVKGIPVSQFGDGTDMGQLIQGSFNVFAGR